MGDRRSTAGFNGTDLGERSTERREFCRGEGVSPLGLATPLLALLTRVVVTDTLAGVPPDTADLLGQKINTVTIKRPKTSFSKLMFRTHKIHTIHSMNINHPVQFW